MDGVLAQLVEHHNGIVGVAGSNPVGSTILPGNGDFPARKFSQFAARKLICAIGVALLSSDPGLFSCLPGKRASWQAHTAQRGQHGIDPVRLDLAAPNHFSDFFGQHEFDFSLADFFIELHGGKQFFSLSRA